MLDVGFFLVCDSRSESSADPAESLSVPVKAFHVLLSGHLFVRHVGDNLRYNTTIAVDSEDVVAHELLTDGVFTFT